MKRFLNSIFVGVLIVANSYSLAIYYAPSDPVQKQAEQSLVESIKKQSNLTQYDVDKWKAWFLGQIAVMPALVVSTYGAALVGDAVGNIVWLGVGGNIVPEKYRFLVDLVGLIPAVATWKLVYPMLSSRTEVGVVGKIGRFEELCRSLSIAKVKEDNLGNLKFHIDDSWKNKSEIAWCLAVDNLIEQCGYAIDLCHQLKTQGIYSDWMSTFYNFSENLKHNRALLAPVYDAEMARRRASDLPFRNGTFY